MGRRSDDECTTDIEGRKGGRSGDRTKPAWAKDPKTGVPATDDEWALELHDKYDAFPLDDSLGWSAISARIRDWPKLMGTQASGRWHNSDNATG